MSGRQAAAPGLPGRRRGSLSWELRTSISLARLLTGRGGSPSTALLQPTIRSGAPRSRQTASRYANNDAKNDARPVRDNYGQPRTIADNRGRTWTRRCCLRQRGPLFPKSCLPVLSLLFVFEKLLKSLITHGNCQFLRNGLPVFLENVLVPPARAEGSWGVGGVDPVARSLRSSELHRRGLAGTTDKPTSVPGVAPIAYQSSDLFHPPRVGESRCQTKKNWRRRPAAAAPPSRLEPVGLRQSSLELARASRARVRAAIVVNPAAPDVYWRLQNVTYLSKW